MVYLIPLVCVAILSAAIFGVNLKLHTRNNQIKAELHAQIERELGANSPEPGWVMPHLKGQASSGEREEISLQGSAPKFTLLLFDPSNCPACDANWPFWNQLMADPEIGVRFFVLTGASSVPEAYWQQHQVTRHPLIIGLDPGLMKQMRMQVTPQTIYLESGTVKKVWFGLLSDADVKEISDAMQVSD